MRLLPAHFGIEVYQTRKAFFSQSEGHLGTFLLITSGFLCFFTKERIESGHTDIKHRSVECCSDCCPSVGFPICIYDHGAHLE